MRLGGGIREGGSEKGKKGGGVRMAMLWGCVLSDPAARPRCGRAAGLVSVS